jgi:hypothetical protein
MLCIHNTNGSLLSIIIIMKVLVNCDKINKSLKRQGVNAEDQRS